MAEALTQLIERTQTERGVEIDADEIWYCPPVKFDERCVQSVRSARSLSGLRAARWSPVQGTMPVTSQRRTYRNDFCAVRRWAQPQRRGERDGCGPGGRLQRSPPRDARRG